MERWSGESLYPVWGRGHAVGAAQRRAKYNLRALEETLRSLAREGGKYLRGFDTLVVVTAMLISG